ncbi:MAG: hypothetical protein EA402_12165 [Planctomycetota bacterium]|nr:MAG: hypothetical protein EA402_12165 [Planctomycetota bacterium]
MLPRVLVIAFCFAAIFTVFIGRLAQLQLVRGDQYAEAVYDSRFRVQVVPARRGRIIDRQGTVIADNRTVFDLAVVLQDMSMAGRQRLRTPVWRLDAQALNLLAGDIARELRRPLGLVRAQLQEELMLNPGVALRTGPREEEPSIGLLVVPRMALLESDDTGEPSVDPGWDVLAATGVLQLDPRQALATEYRMRLGEELRLLDGVEWSRLIQRLSQRFQTHPEHLSQVFLPFAPEVSLVEFPSAENELRWRALSETRQRQAEVSLARLVGVSVTELREVMDEFLLLHQSRGQDMPWLFVPAARIGALAQHLPADATVRELAVSGLLPVRERLYLIQGASPEDEGMFGLILGRLRSSLAIPGELGDAWLAALIERHAERLHVRRAEREHRRYHLMLDAQLVDLFSHQLSRQLAGGAQELSPLQVEQRLTQARRLADRDWRGQTRVDPLVVVEDIEPQIANRMAGFGASVPWHLARHFEETTALAPGLRVITRVGREYPYPGHASHLIGYLGRLSSVFDTSTALAMGLDPAGWVGRSGLEAQYDELLQGSNGRRAFLRTPQGMRLIEEVNPNPGVDIHLTLDLELQRTAERACLNWFQLAEALGQSTPRMEAAYRRVNHQRAAMVLLDVEDGALLALASSPGYNLYDVRSRYAELADPAQHPGQPLIDHASTASHPPGSTVKPLVTLIALAEGATRPDEVFFSRGYMARSAGGQPILREFQPFTPREFNIPDSLARSSNVVSATLAERVGPQQLTTWMRLFGMGERIAIDVGWQRPGILPSPENLSRVRPREPTWYPSDTWRAGIGQFASSSPLQMAVIPAAVANGGRIVRPHLWRDALRDQPRLDPPGLALTPQQLRPVQRGMEMVTQAGGTATALRLSGAGAGIAVAAKTGTSEWGTPATRDHERALRDPRMVWTPSHAWMIGYAPASAPRVAFAVFVYGGTSGGRACTGIVKEVLEAYFERYPEGHR